MKYYRFLYASLFTLVMPSSAFAAGPELPNYGSILLRIIFVCLAICVLAVVLIKKGLPRLAHRNEESRLHIIDRLALGPGQSIVIVELNGESLVLGVTQHSINLLQTPAEEPPNNTPVFHVKHPDLKEDAA